MLRAFYDWTMRQAEKPQAIWVLAAISFIESSVFPIPPDVLLIPLVLSRREAAFRIALVCTLASVTGGWLGYAIGFYLFEAVGRPVLEFYHAMASYDRLQQAFADYGAWIIVIKGMTPIPYKLLTIASGALHFDFWTFSIASIISRSLRFFLLAGLLWYFGASIQTFIEKRLTLLTSLFAALIVLGFVAVVMMGR